MITLKIANRPFRKNLMNSQFPIEPSLSMYMYNVNRILHNPISNIFVNLNLRCLSSSSTRDWRAAIIMASWLILDQRYDRDKIEDKILFFQSSVSQCWAFLLYSSLRHFDVGFLNYCLLCITINVWTVDYF